jgi:hypothetical protein
MFACRFSVVLVVLLLASSASAQGRKRGIEWRDWESSGTVEGVGNGTLLMTLEGNRWVGAVPAAARVAITGAAERDVLRPGVIVRFSAEFDRKTGAATEPVSELEIVTPRQGDRTGVFPDEVVDPTEKRKGPPPATAKLRIFDAISGVKENTIFFKRYRVELAAEVTISVNATDPSLLSPGDEIKRVRGKRIAGVDGRLVVEQLEAVLAKPLSMPKKRAPQTANAKGRASKTDAAKTDIFNVAGDEAAGKNSDAEPEEKDAEKKEDKKEAGSGGEKSKKSRGKSTAKRSEK